VRRIFRMIGVEGISQNAVHAALEQEGIPAPGGGKHWERRFFRACVLEDVYKPHSFEEIKALVAPEVAARLDPDKCYGVWWFNRQRVHAQQVSEATQSGRRYRRRVQSATKPREEWIAVPIPDAGIPCEVVEAARAVIRNNRAPSKAGHRFWVLSGGIARCGVCGNRMENRSLSAKAEKYHYFYYRCQTHHQHGDDAGSQKKITGPRS
jgi:hypothetical protein